MEVPRWNVHTTEPAAKAGLCPSHPTLLHLLPSPAVFLLPAPLSTPFQRHFPPRCRTDAEEPGTVTHGSDVPRCCSLLPLLGSSSRLDTVNGLSTVYGCSGSVPGSAPLCAAPLRVPGSPPAAGQCHPCHQRCHTRGRCGHDQRQLIRNIKQTQRASAWVGGGLGGK